MLNNPLAAAAAQPPPRPTLWLWYCSAPPTPSLLINSDLHDSMKWSRAYSSSSSPCAWLALQLFLQEQVQEFQKKQAFFFCLLHDAWRQRRKGKILKKKFIWVRGNCGFPTTPHCKGFFCRLLLRQLPAICEKRICCPYSCWEDALNSVILSGWPVRHLETHLWVKQSHACCQSAPVPTERLNTQHMWIWIGMHGRTPIPQMCTLSQQGGMVITIQPRCTCVPLICHLLLLYCTICFPSSITCSPGSLNLTWI